MDSTEISDPMRLFLLPHPDRDDAWKIASEFAARVADAGIECFAKPESVERLQLEGAKNVEGQEDSSGCAMIVTFGGDGTILRAVDLGRANATPILGVNLGHMGFLAEAEPGDLDTLVAAVVTKDYTLERRDTLDVQVFKIDGSHHANWALNEVSIEKGSLANMLDLLVAVDGQPVSRWSCDGVVCATPTGSTAYAWSAGGPVVWPDVEALTIVPISAHALFSRPLVVGPNAVISIELSSSSPSGAAWCDGRRTIELEAGSRLVISRSSQPVEFARLNEVPFADRLVRKFELPIDGWRGSST